VPPPDRAVNWAIGNWFREMAKIEQAQTANDSQRHPPWRRFAIDGEAKTSTIQQLVSADVGREVQPIR
jgi:hypothetical protein